MDNFFSKRLANHLHNVYFGGNWTSVNLHDLLEDVSLNEAQTQYKDFNTILKLSFHVTYYVDGIYTVLTENKLEVRDKYSYDHPELTTAIEWQTLKQNWWQTAEKCVQLLNETSDEDLKSAFANEKYGDYFTNVLGIIEHMHYHMGQISLLKKLLRQK